MRVQILNTEHYNTYNLFFISPPPNINSEYFMIGLQVLLNSNLFCSTCLEITLNYLLQVHFSRQEN